MSDEEASPLDAAPDAVTAQTGAAADTTSTDARPADAALDPPDTLSPAVRRLVRQFDLDITGIHGTGPSGRIRVGDVMGLLGGRTDTGNRGVPARAQPPEDDAEAATGPATNERVAPASHTATAAAPAGPAGIPTTTIFECDLSRLLAHRRKLRLAKVDLLTTSYFVTALAAALEATPEITAGEPPRFGVSLTTADGRLRCSVLAVPDTLPESLAERVRAVDIALRANLHTPLEHSNLLIHHYGESGSLLAMPTPIGAGHTASVGIGRIRREIAVRLVDGVETPRITARCHLSVSFLAERVSLHVANRVLGAAVAILETWPE
jgi:2-oxoglutarate dehydrogenase E2 component (dihydrolipoamide succinyltransferase)